MIVEQKIKEQENSAVELAITVAKDALLEQYNSVVSKYTKTIQIPGFRKGKVPKNVLEQKFGPSLKEESLYTVIDQAVEKAIEQVEEKYKPLPYSNPSLVDEEKLSKEIDQDLSFAVTYDVMPTFEIPPYTDLEIEVPAVKVDKKDVDKELKKLQEQNAMIIEKDSAVVSGDIVTIDYIELDSEGNGLDETKREDYVFTIGTQSNLFLLDEDLIGMSEGESKTVEKKFEEDYKYAEYAGKTVTLKVDLKKVKYRDVPKLDDEFAQDVSEEYETLNDLTKATKEKLESDLEQHLRSFTLNALADQLRESVTITIPKSMVDLEIESAWRRFVSNSGIAEEQLLQILQFQGQTKEQMTEKWREDAKKTLQVQLLMDKIKEKENFSIEEEELNKEVELQLGDSSDEQTRSYYRFVIEDDLKMKKLESFLLENNKTKAGETLSYEEFIKKESNHETE